MTVMERFRRYRDHNNERPFDPPEPNIVRLIPPEDNSAPVLSFPPIRDHETLALEAATAMTPMRAYWLALTWGPTYAASWSAWVKTRHQREWLRFLEEEDR